MSRKVLILANVGNRDVLHGGEELRPAREKGAELLARFDEAAAQIELPIVSPALKYISSAADWRAEISGEDAERPTVALFYTDQDDPRYCGNDTVGFAKVMQRKLIREFQSGDGLWLAAKKQIRLAPIRESPARYDDMYSFYREFFAGNECIRDPRGWLCFVLTSGGTPAMNAMLLLHAVQHFGENCVQIYVSPEGEAYDMRVGEEIVRAATERRVNEALGALQFRAAAEILENTARSGYRAAAFRYAEHRLAFDFYRAERHCREAIKAAEDGTRRYLENQARAAQRLEQGGSDPALLIEELFYNLEVKYCGGEFVDVLGRVFRLQEALLTWIVEENTALRTGERRKLLPDQAEAIGEVPGLRKFLESYRTEGGNRLELKRDINRIGLMAVVEYLAEPKSGLPDQKREEASKAVEAAKSIEKLANLRNKTILAHGFEGVSEKRLTGEEGYGSDTLIEDLRKGVGEALGRDLSTNPFLELAERLRF